MLMLFIGMYFLFLLLMFSVFRCTDISEQNSVLRLLSVQIQVVELWGLRISAIGQLVQVFFSSMPTQRGALDSFPELILDFVFQVFAEVYL